MKDSTSLPLSGTRVIFLDIDGTILPGDHSVPTDRVLDALKRAQDAGHFVFINTGRALGNISDALLHCFPFDGYVMGCGSHILVRGECIFRQWLTKDFCKALVGKLLSWEKKYWCVFEGETTLYHIFTPWLKEEATRIHSPADFDGIFREIPMTKVGIGITCEEEDPEPGLDEFLGKLQFYRHPNYFEISPAGANKATGIDRVMEHLQLPLANSIAIGDSGNDREMIEHAGLGVAMGNSSPEILELADVIAPACNEDGVAVILEQLLGF